MSDRVRLRYPDWIVAGVARVEREHGIARVVYGEHRDRVRAELQRRGLWPTADAAYAPAGRALGVVLVSLGDRRVAVLREGRDPLIVPLERPLA